MNAKKEQKSNKEGQEDNVHYKKKTVKRNAMVVNLALSWIIFTLIILFYDMEIICL